MSRFLKIGIVLLTIAAMAAPAFASDLTMSGQMRVEGYYNDLDSADDPSMNWDQRFRVNTVFKVSDEVKAVIRFDFGERQWGVNGQNSIRHESFSTRGVTQIDKAYLQIDKEMFTLSAGQQFFGSNDAILVDHLGTGIVLKVKTPVALKFQFTKYDENGSYVDEGDTDDTNFYSAEAAFSNDDFSVTGVYAVLDNAATDENKSAFGLSGKFNVANFAIKAELDLLDGDDGGDTDYTGTQLFVDANTNVSETLNVGGFFWYVAGTDDADEEVIVDVTNWDSWNPNWGGFVGQGVSAAAPISGWGPNDMIGSEGLISAALYATLKVNDDLGLKFQGQFGFEEEDAAADFDYMMLTASAKYKVATNTYFMSDIIYEDIDGTDGGEDFDDNSISIWSKLYVNF